MKSHIFACSVTAIISALGLALSANPAEAGLRFSMEAGVARVDPKLDDYRWEDRVASQWGIGIEAEAARFGVGARWLHLGSSQGLGPVEEHASVSSVQSRWDAFELTGSAQLTSWRSLGVRGKLGVGRMRLGFDPDRVSLQLEGGQETTVEFRSMNEWTGSLGLETRVACGSRCDLGIAVDHHWYGFETAHRNGGDIETGVEGFGQWNARIGLGLVLAP